MAVRARIALLALVAFVPACTGPAAVGEACTDSADCGGGFSCISIGDPADAEYVCMTDCDLTMVRLCDGGEVCTDPLAVGRPDDVGVCYLGGDVAVGSACADNFECVAGAQCIIVGSSGTCRQACSTDGMPGCASGETCTMLSGTAGFCEPVAP